MIVFVRGKLASIEDDGVVLESKGIGYSICITRRERDRITTSGAEEVLLYTHLQIKEDEWVLFGFCDRTELYNFRKLISVNGVGGKTALNIMDILSSDELYLAIQSGDIKSISKASGVGSKTAQRIVLELKDSIRTSGEEMILPQGAPDAEGRKAEDEVIEALIGMGFSQSQAFRAVRSVAGAGELETEELLRLALRKL